jgi:hypothetical protein
VISLQATSLLSRYCNKNKRVYLANRASMRDHAFAELLGVEGRCLICLHLLAGITV